MLTRLGLDLGNTWTKICIDGLFAKIPSRYAFEKPAGPISKKTGQELKAQTFSLLFNSKRFWFGCSFFT